MTKYKWNEQQEQLLITWAEKSSGYSWLHSKSMNYYRYKNLYISVEVRFCFFNLIDIFDAKPISIRVVIKPPSDLS